MEFRAIGPPHWRKVLIINNNKQIHEAINAISKNIETTEIHEAETHKAEIHETFKGSLNESETNDDNELENIDLDNL